MKISTKGRYALEALLHMAYMVKHEPVAIREIAEQTALSEKYLEQLFFALRKKGIIATVRGPKGGYYIEKDFDELTAGDIIRAVEGELAPVPCLKENGVCEFNMENCITRRLWRKVSDTVDTVLDGATLSGLLADYERLILESRKQDVYYI
jgi:Rrf2 family cysteine metabolism transcriptional repressor